MQFAQILKKIMDEKHITKYRLAKDLGVHQTTVKNWLDEKTEPKFEMIERIANALQIRTKDLLFLDKISNMDQSELESLIETEDFLSQFINEENASKQVIEQQIREQEAIYSRAQELGIDAQQLLNYFNQLNHNGKKEALKRTQELTYIEQYTKPDDVENK